MGLFGDLFKPKAQSDQEADQSTRILARLKNRRGAETGKWLSIMENASRTLPPPGPPPTIADLDSRDVIDEAPYVPPIEAQYKALSPGQNIGSATVAASTSEADSVPEDETVTWVNSLFAEFARQANEFNATAAGTDMVLTVRPPEFTFEEPKYGEVYAPQKKISVFKGHVTGLHWSMLVQGYEDKIDVYIISADEILNFTFHDIRKSQTSPFMTISSSIVNSHRVWNVGGTTISAETVHLLAKELLGDLVRVATGTMSDAELFADHSQGLKLGETVAQGYAPAPVAAPAQPGVGQSNTLQDQVARLATWNACQALLNALDKDLAWVTSQAGSFDPEKDPQQAAYFHDLSTALRTLSGQVDGLLATHRSSTASKYNAS